MYVLEPLDPSARKPGSAHAGAWPLERALFEQSLRDGRIEGRHWPAELPDDLEGYRSATQRPRRHRLRYIWDAGLPALGVISCNPSSATRRRVDDTLHLTVNQAALWGFGGIDQGNLDPVYETNSKLMDSTADLADPANRSALEGILENPTVWLAWGNKPTCLKGPQGSAWRNAEQHVLAAGSRRQEEGASFVVTTLNQPTCGRAPAHASPRRFPPKAPPVLHIDPMRVRIVER